MRDYFPRAEFQRIGLSEVAIRALEKIADFVQTQQELAAAQADIVANGDAIDAANTDITAANAAINALDARIDAYDALDPFVRQDQAARPSYTAYAGQNVSVGYVEAEVQQIDDKLVLLSTAFDTLLTRLDTVNLLT